MNFHRHQSTKNWRKLTLSEQMANIGSEVYRAINWQKKGNLEYSQMAFFRAVDLLDLTIEAESQRPGLTELTRAKELLVDFFLGENLYSTSAKSWQQYFFPFNFQARLNHSI